VESYLDRWQIDVFRGFVFFDFVTCPSSFRTKRHDNLFVYDDDDDDREERKAIISGMFWVLTPP